MELIKYVKDMLGMPEGTVMDSAVDMGLSTIPALGKLYQSYQIFKLNKRVKAHTHQLLTIQGKIEEHKNEIFYKEEVFPLIVKQLMNEDEDIKTKVIINGFEHAVDNDLHEVEQLYHYYDVLSQLRYSDILLFVEKYMPFHKQTRRKLNIKLPSWEELHSKEYQRKHKERKSIESYQNNKLIRLGLIEDAYQTFSDLDAEGKVVNEKLEITTFGERFLEFFTIDMEDSETNK